VRYGRAGMHPVVTNSRGLALYFTAWMLLGLLLGLPILGAEIGAWKPALALFLPPYLFFGFLGLAAWYPCRANPIPATPLPRLMAVHLSAALASSALWWGAADLWARTLSTLQPGLTPLTLRPDALPHLAIGVLLYLLATTVQYLLLAFEAARLDQERSLELRLLAREAELAAFKSQIDPHFLFNCLNSISALCGSEPQAARTMSIRLGEFLRSSLRLAARDLIPLTEEIDLARAYLGIEQVRFGDRLIFEERVDANALTVEVPALVLQPLLENSIKHGLAHQVSGGTITLTGKRDGGRLELCIENPVDSDSALAQGDGIGLTNVAGRLELLYQGNVRLAVERGEEIFRVTLDLPEA
jgi:two-component system sensor histidine kinase AlgZ